MDDVMPLITLVRLDLDQSGLSGGIGSWHSRSAYGDGGAGTYAE